MIQIISVCISIALVFATISVRSQVTTSTFLVMRNFALIFITLSTYLYELILFPRFRLHGGDNVQIKRYFVSFWNGVDLRYKLLKGPKIRISIAGIIISRVRDRYLIVFDYSIGTFAL